VRWAYLTHKDLTLPFKDLSIQNHIAVGTDALCEPNCAFSAYTFARHIRNLD
jgi:hypothetical protein